MGGGGCVLAMKIETLKGGGGSGGMLPRENFRSYELPCTTFREFSRWRKRERECKVVKKKRSIASA